MKIDFGAAKDIKLAADQLIEGALWELMEEWAGKYQPQYDPALPESLGIAHGKAEIVQSIRNISRLTEEQIVELFKSEGH